MLATGVADLFSGAMDFEANSQFFRERVAPLGIAGVLAREYFRRLEGSADRKL